MSERFTQDKMITNADTIMESKKHNFGERFSQFLTKIFWHLDRQAVPMYSSSNRNGSTCSASKKSINKRRSNSCCQRSPSNSSQYPAGRRTCPIRQRAPTLMSIQEE